MERGDANGDARVDISDCLVLLSFAFYGVPACPLAGDVDLNGRLEPADATSLLGWLFLGTALPSDDAIREIPCR
jgi:hypothetical protein